LQPARRLVLRIHLDDQVKPVCDNKTSVFHSGVSGNPGNLHRQNNSYPLVIPAQAGIHINYYQNPNNTYDALYNTPLLKTKVPEYIY
jgi:hypothetical protein